MAKIRGYKEGTYYARNRERILAAARERYRATSTRRRQTGRKKEPWYKSLCGARRRARKKGWDFDLTEEWARARWTGRCELTGIEFTSGMYTVSIDRIDNNRGYTQDNCRFVLYAVNALKSVGTDDDVVRVAQAIVSSAAPNSVS